MKMRAIQALAISALATAAFAQQQGQPSTAQNPSVAPGATQTQPAKPTSPAEDPTATTSTTPAPPAQNSQDKSVTPDQQANRPAQPSSEAAQQAKQSQQAKPSQQQSQQSQLPQSDAGVASLDTSGLSSAELQQKIEAALRAEPTLSNSNLTVNVKDDEIDVNGTVGTGKERTTASRIVQSFGENRKVKEKINVSGVKK